MASHKRAKEHGARRQGTGLGAVDKARISHPGQWVSSYFLTLPVWFWFWCWCRCCWFSGCGSHLNLPTGGRFGSGWVGSVWFGFGFRFALTGFPAAAGCAAQLGFADRRFIKLYNLTPFQQSQQFYLHLLWVKLHKFYGCCGDRKPSTDHRTTASVSHSQSGLGLQINFVQTVRPTSLGNLKLCSFVLSPRQILLNSGNLQCHCPCLSKLGFPSALTQLECYLVSALSRS